jgi:hypothetical protein
LGYSWKRVRLSLKNRRNEDEFRKKQEDLRSLILLHKEAYIDLYYSDESHFGLTPNVPYAWQRKGEPILLPASKSQRLTVLGFMTIDCQLETFVSDGSMTSQLMIECIDEFAKYITKKTVIVLDNAPIHRSKLFKSKIKQWQEQDLFIFFLPPYSPELNKIEILWRFIKYKWLNFDAFLNFNNLKERLNDVINNIGTKYVINFY